MRLKRFLFIALSLLTTIPLLIKGNDGYLLHILTHAEGTPQQPIAPFLEQPQQNQQPNQQTVGMLLGWFEPLAFSIGHTELNTQLNQALGNHRFYTIRWPITRLSLNGNRHLFQNQADHFSLLRGNIHSPWVTGTVRAESIPDRTLHITSTEMKSFWPQILAAAAIESGYALSILGLAFYTNMPDIGTGASLLGLSILTGAADLTVEKFIARKYNEPRLSATSSITLTGPCLIFAGMAGIAAYTYFHP